MITILHKNNNLLSIKQDKIFTVGSLLALHMYIKMLFALLCIFA